MSNETAQPLAEQADVLTTAQAAAFMKVHPQTMTKLGPSLGTRVGRVWRFSRARLVQYLMGDAGERVPLPEAVASKAPALRASKAANIVGLLAARPGLRRRRRME